MPTYCFDFFVTGPSHEGRREGIPAWPATAAPFTGAVIVRRLRGNRHTCEHGRNPQHHPNQLIAPLSIYPSLPPLSSPYELRTPTSGESNQPLSCSVVSAIAVHGTSTIRFSCSSIGTHSWISRARMGRHTSSRTESVWSLLQALQLPHFSATTLSLNYINKSISYS